MHLEMPMADVKRMRAMLESLRAEESYLMDKTTDVASKNYRRMCVDDCTKLIDELGKQIAEQDWEMLR